MKIFLIPWYKRTMPVSHHLRHPRCLLAGGWLSYPWGCSCITALVMASTIVVLQRRRISISPIHYGHTRYTLG